ncbi:GGDEF domain-containing protein [Geobacter pelophilus]|jgi:diguanylate cyclase (GGDEF)-like protein|uniref:diguanylate cyclase n=1 Tax=Geoanaerobacter pelophilus TaxID=60036 RepID=A0AAW4L570_9BACT|nr:GGDEF domain-containing protein [Geoanaerobacter pelophilus]MBT0664965.1 GGDEF domain-containing protein [Geoanaerobacter pelophilus]
MRAKKCIVIECLYFLESLNSGKLLALGMVLTIIIGIADNLIGNSFSLSLFYLIPISLFAWYVSINAALTLSSLCAFIWATSNNVMGFAPLVSNILTNLGFYWLFSVIIHKSRVMYEHEKFLSRTDHLTGLLNSRSFYDVAQNYLCIMKRRQAPFALAFLDLDNFKTINDEYGHDVGDTVLKDFADSIMATIRNTDKAARLGGDEFVIFFPDTTSESISLIMNKIIDAAAQRMQAFNYDLSFSAGVVCCLESKQSLDELITAADKLMYEVKNCGKGSFRYKEISP